MYVPDSLLLLLVFVSVFLLVVSLPGLADLGFIGSLRARRTERFEQWLRSLFQKRYTGEQLATWHDLSLVVAFGLPIAAFRNSSGIVLGLVLAALVWWAPHAIYWWEYAQRRKKLEENIPPALDQLASAVRSGMTLSQALAEVSSYAPAPVSEEFEQIAGDQNLGQDLTAALLAAKGRVDSRVFDLVVTAFLVNIEQGGNLPKAIDNLTASLKEIWRLEQKLHTASAEGRKGALVLCVMPLFIGAMVAFMEPELLSNLVSSAPGYMVLVVAIMLYVSGVYWINRILNVSI